jgi:hypothetical protein
MSPHHVRILWFIAIASTFVSVVVLPGDDREVDPCDHRPAGRALGLQRRCEAVGNSSGVAKADFNADGVGDLAIGVPFEDVIDTSGSSRADAGVVQIIYGSPDGIGLSDTAGPGNQLWSQASQGVPDSVEAGDRFGASLAAGDFNGDGISDLAIGVPGEDVLGLVDAGAVNVIYGSLEGLSTTEGFAAQFLHQGIAGVPGGLSSRDGFATALAWGDFDADDISDLAIGVPFEDVSGQDDAGGVNVIHGSTFGLDPNGEVEAEFWTQDSEDIQDTAEAGDRFGSSLAAGGFLSPDIDYLAIGVPYEDLPGGVDAGGVLILRAGNGLTATGNQYWSQDAPGVSNSVEDGDRFGFSLAVGQWRNPSAPPGLRTGAFLAIGAPYEDLGSISKAGIVHVIYALPGVGLDADFGPVGQGDELFSQNAEGFPGTAEEGDLFGYSIAASRFESSLAIGVPNEDLGSSADAGAVNWVGQFDDGSPVHQLLTGNTGAINAGVAPGDQFGSALSVWSFRPFTFAPDLAIGVPGKDTGNAPLPNFKNGAGAVAVVYNAGNGVLDVMGDSEPAPRLFTQCSGTMRDNCEAGDQFGAAIY